MTNIDAVDVFLGVFLPPIGALIVYATAYSTARVVSGGRPLSALARAIFLHLSFFTLGMGYLIAVFGIFKLPALGLLASLLLWACLVVSIAWWRRMKL